MLTGLVKCCVGTDFYNTLLKYRWKNRRGGDEEEDVRSYWMTLRNREDTGN